MASISDYTEAEFLGFIQKILTTNNAGSDEEFGVLLEKFRALACHPSGTDLIFYPERGEESSAEGVIQIIKQWRAAQGLPCFKDI